MNFYMREQCTLLLFLFGVFFVVVGFFHFIPKSGSTRLLEYTYTQRNCILFGRQHNDSEVSITTFKANKWHKRDRKQKISIHLLTHQHTRARTQCNDITNDKPRCVRVCVFVWVHSLAYRNVSYCKRNIHKPIKWQLMWANTPTRARDIVIKANKVNNQDRVFFFTPLLPLLLSRFLLLLLLYSFFFRFLAAAFFGEQIIETHYWMALQNNINYNNL